MQTHRDQDDDMLRWLAPDPATVRLAIGMVEPLDWRAFRTRSSDLTGVRGAVKLGSLKVE